MGMQYMIKSGVSLLIIIGFLIFRNTRKQAKNHLQNSLTQQNRTPMKQIHPNSSRQSHYIEQEHTK